MKHRWRVYIKPFDDYGVYQSGWTEVTSDVDFLKMGSLAVDLDNTEYDIGVYRSSNFSLTLNNLKGKYSDVGGATSIFHYKRSNSLCKVTWEIEEDGPWCGTAIADECYLSEETTVFTGLINDDSLTMEISDQKVTFQVLGRESIFQKVIVPFGSIHNGDLTSQVIYACLNQTKITDLLTVSLSNINPGIDQAIDSIASLQNKTVQEGLNNLLLATNSVLYIVNDTIYVGPRTASATNKFTFYGQASEIGPENVQAIKKIKTGIAKTFNFFTWQGTTLVSQDASSIAKYDARTKEVSVEFFTDNTKRQNIIDVLRNEFYLPKQEFDLYAPLNYDTIALGLLDKVNIDYPAVYYQTNDPFPICGSAICGEAVLPIALWSFTVSILDFFKIIGRSIDTKTGLIMFKLRGV